MRPLAGCAPGLRLTETFAQLNKTNGIIIPAKAGIQYYQ
jgi:hypothetical protein